MDQKLLVPMTTTTPSSSSEELMQAQAEIWRLSYSYIKSMALRCAVKLGIPTAIHRSGGGGGATLPELLAAVQLPETKRAPLSRLMRLLTELGIFDVDGASGGEAAVYRLTPVSRLLVEEANGSGGGACLSRFVTTVTALSFDLTAYLRLDEWFKSDASAETMTPFMMANGGRDFWAADGWNTAERRSEFNEHIMGSDTRLVAEVVVRECGDVFRGVASVVDVGGGNGTMARAIAKAFPHVKCSVLELPHVVENMGMPGASGTVDGVQFVAGDMMEFIPPADAVLLKNVLHDWSDEDCVRILERCREAISAAGPTGKVVIVEMVVGRSPSSKEAFEAQLLMDMCMMVLCTGKEREEETWIKIFKESGFSRYKTRPVLGARSLIEIYP